jgi:hypothetical protein
MCTFNRYSTRVAFLRAMTCKGILAHEESMFVGNAFTGLSKDVGWSMADANIAIIFGVRRKLVG